MALFLIHIETQSCATYLKIEALLVRKNLDIQGCTPAIVHPYGGLEFADLAGIDVHQT